MAARSIFLLAAALLACGAAAQSQTTAPASPDPAAGHCPCMGQPMAGGMMGHGPHGGAMGAPGGPQGGAMGGPGGHGGPMMMGDLSAASEAQLRSALQMHNDCVARLQAELQRRQAAPR